MRKIVGALVVLLIIGALAGCGSDSRNIDNFLNAFTSAGHTVQHELGAGDSTFPELSITDSITIWIGSGDVFAAKLEVRAVI